MEQTADPIRELISDLRWQVNQMGPRGIKTAAGSPYNPSVYKRGLQAAVERGGTAVTDFVSSYVRKPPSGGYRKLEEADCLDLACESLVADAEKPYADLFTDEDRTLARKRLAHHAAAIEARDAARALRIQARRTELPSDAAELSQLAAQASDPEESIAVNLEILNETPDDVVALNRLGRGYETVGAKLDALEVFDRVLELDAENSVAQRRAYDIRRKL